MNISMGKHRHGIIGKLLWNAGAGMSANYKRGEKKESEE